MASPDHSSSSDADDEVVLPPAPASVVQTINIRSHVPVTLDMEDSNYSQWRCLFDTVLGKFGLTAHVTSPALMEQRDAEWTMIDHSVVNWIYNLHFGRRRSSPSSVHRRSIPSTQSSALKSSTTCTFPCPKPSTTAPSRHLLPQSQQSFCSW
ncbi:unnamed protein product [Urochloa humidicola]